MKEFDGVLAEFPFDGNSDGLIKCPSRSVAISQILTALVASVIGPVPAHLDDANEAGSGKSLLADCTSLVATGRNASELSFGQTEEELEKRLAGALLRGGPVTVIDNVEQAIDSEFLNTVV